MCIRDSFISGELFPLYRRILAGEIRGVDRRRARFIAARDRRIEQRIGTGRPVEREAPREIICLLYTSDIPSRSSAAMPTPARARRKTGFTRLMASPPTPTKPATKPTAPESTPPQRNSHAPFWPRFRSSLDNLPAAGRRKAGPRRRAGLGNPELTLSLIHI